MLKSLLLAIALCIIPLITVGQAKSVLLEDATDKVYVKEELAITSAQHQPLTLQAIQNLSFKTFEQWADDLQPDQVYWGMLSVHNESTNVQENTRWVVEFPIVLTDVDVLVVYSDGKTIAHKTGQFVPVQHRSFTPEIKSNIVQISVPDGEDATVYFQAQCDRWRAQPKLHLTLYAADHYFHGLKNTRYYQGLFIGFMLMMLIYNLFLYFFAERDKAYVHYSIYILGIVLYAAYNSGDLAYLTNSLFISHFPKYAYLGKTSTYLVIFGYLHFLRNFFHLDDLLPRWNMLLKGVLWINAIAFVADVTLMLATNFNSNIADVVTVGNAVIFLLFIFSFCPTLFKVKNKDAYFIIAGIALMGLGAIVTIIARINGVDYSTAAFQMGTIFEVMVFSLGLASRRKRIMAEKQEAYIDLQKTEMLREQERTETERLKELDQLKSQLYTNITHEFRTPLTIIDGHLDDINGYEQQKSIIKRNSAQLLRLINQVLDLSKMDAKLLEVDLLKGDIVAYLQYLTESFHSLASAKDIRLTFFSEDEQIVMDFDKDKIEHIVYNLISNAIKFTDSGGEISLSLRKVQENTQSKLRLRVKDNGHGMTEEQLPHIFDRFHKLSDSGHPGTGIGLAFVKEIVDLLKGQIQVKSALAQGTEVDVFLPITTTHPSMDISSSSRPVKTLPITSEVELTPSEDLPLLLLIEDNREVSAYIRKLLHKRYDIHLAFDGKQGHDQALALVPDIIICDVMMPKMNGFQVTRQLKENQKTSHIPIILLTAKATQADKNEGLQSGADTFLMKPFNKQELFIRLANMDRQRKVLIEKFRLGLLDAGDTPDSKGHPTREHAFLQTVQQSLLDHIEDSDFGVEDIANGMNLSKNQFYRKMKALTGQSPTVYVRDIRLNEARDLLERTTMNVSEIAFRVGFNDPNYFTRLFHRKFGKAPSQYAVKR